MLTSMPFQLLSGKGWPTVLCSQQQRHTGQLEARPCHSFLSEPESSFSSSLSELPSGCRASLDSESAVHKLNERQFCRMRRDIAVLVPTYPFIFKWDFQFLLISSMILFPYPQRICKGRYQGHGLEGSIHSVCLLLLVQAVLPSVS